MPTAQHTVPSVSRVGTETLPLPYPHPVLNTHVLWSPAQGCQRWGQEAILWFSSPMFEVLCSACNEKCPSEHGAVPLALRAEASPLGGAMPPRCQAGHVGACCSVLRYSLSGTKGGDHCFFFPPKPDTKN